MSRFIKLILILSILVITYTCASRYRYKPSVMPPGKGELTKRQIKRDFTN